MYFALSTCVGLYGSGLFNFGSYVSLPTLFAWFLGFDVPTSSFIFIENVVLLFKAREGHYGKAIKLLKSTAIASSGDLSALNDLSNRHPQSEPLDFNPSIPSSLVLDCNQVLSSLQSFPKSSSPGGSQLHAQHLYIVVVFHQQHKNV